MKKNEILAEFIGSFFLVFMSAGAGVINATNSSIGHLGGSIISGLVVTTLIYTFGHISGAHFNPVVSLSFLFLGDIKYKKALSYIFIQSLASILAAYTLYFLFGNLGNLGATTPSGNIWQSFILEILLTFFLLFIIMGSAVHGKAIKSFAGISIGSAVTVACLVGGTISGSAMNPIRTLGPSIVSGNISTLWIYLLAPTIGGLLATFIYKHIHEIQ